QVGMVVTPRQMHEFAVDRGAINDGVTVVELGVELAERGNLSGADEGEVLRPEEQHFPLALVRFVGDALERLVRVDRNDGVEVKCGKTVTDGQHAWLLGMGGRENVLRRHSAPSGSID